MATSILFLEWLLSNNMFLNLSWFIDYIMALQCDTHKFEFFTNEISNAPIVTQTNCLKLCENTTEM